MQKEAKSKIKALVDKYELVATTGKIKKYTEEETKNAFIKPLFEALGWDFSEKDEVSAEEHVSLSGRLDYGFYINGRPKFYLEVKKLKADLNNEEFARQAIKYSFNKGVAWAVLTDFEGIKVFNAQSPSKYLGDKLYFELKYSEYLDRFDKLWELSKESFKEDLIDQKAIEAGKKLQKIPITELLSKDLNECRKILTEQLGKWNPDVSQELLDEGVQKLLDRLVFIKVAEDRKIENNVLLPLINQWRLLTGSNKPTLYQSMTKKFRDLDDIYNSNIFKEHPFETWQESGEVLEEVLNILNGKKGYYEFDFSIMSADTLGSVYENYLGYKLSQSQKGLTLHKDAGKRKEQGIYYTPPFIVDYIVRNALKSVLNKCTSVNELKKIKVLDPACGSGSFLIKALEVILEKYEDFNYEDNENLRIQIILENIYGVDLDEQAVEIARLNLLVNALKERGELPLLENNIKNGNSLISGTDEELKKYFGKNFRDKKPFNWEEQFLEVFKQGGFDVIIGNPPYIKEFINKSAFDGLHNSPYYQGKMDIWTMFACISIDLLKPNGILSFIAPNNWISNAGASIFRDKILKEGELKTFVNFNDYKVFKQVGIQTMIFIFQKKKPSKKYRIEYLRVADKNTIEEKLIVDIFGEKQKIEIEPEKLVGRNITFSNSELKFILNKIENKKNLDLLEEEVGQGIVAAPDKYFLEGSIESYSEKERMFLKPFYTASGRYKSGESDNYIFYICDKNFGNKKIEDYPNIKKHFSPFEKILKQAKEKYETPDKPYFYLHRERKEEFFNAGPKIVCGVRVISPCFFYTEEPYYGSRALNFIKSNRINLKYLTGILNSKVSFFWLKNKGKQLGDLLQIDKGPLFKIPIYVGDKSRQATIINLVDKMLSFNKELQKITKNSNKWKSLKEEIEKTDKKIDEEVYKLYDLTPEEIKIVESFN